MMDRQLTAEKDQNCVLDQAADPTATMLSEMCGLLADKIPLRDPLDQEQTKRILQAMGYAMGRWIYLIDACDDYEKDQKHHNFNPFLLDNREDLPAYMQANLNHALSDALLSYGLLDKGRYDSIIQNVLCVSCVNIQKKIISKYTNENETED